MGLFSQLSLHALIPECKFYIQFFNNSEQNGRSVMLFATQGDQKMVVCCSDDRCGIKAKAMVRTNKGLTDV